MARTSRGPRTAAQRIGRKLDAFPDRIDIRDWRYRPQLVALPDQYINCHAVPKILDQGKEGACTGFALAAVINFLLDRRGREGRFVSPRMLYELARRYDEWPGEEYEGSSARGAMKAWIRHGACREETWPNESKGLDYFNDDVSRDALETPGGAFYRVMHRQIRDMHAALLETGILYCTLMVHRGWSFTPKNARVETRYSDERGNSQKFNLPVITRKGRADGGHAIAIVGYTREGFIIQNSWGDDWGDRGFALLPYDDYLMHAVDVWVAQLGVPVNTDIWTDEKWADTTADRGRVEQTISLHQVRPYVIDVGNNGQLSLSGNYWTTPSDVSNLFNTTIPEKTKKWKKKRVLLYVHGGLNDENAVARRIISFREVMEANEIYPLHIMWETGLFETIRNIVGDLFTDEDRAEGIGDWMKNLRDGLTEAKDRTFEMTVSPLGRSLWSEMKENARLASTHPTGAMRVVEQSVSQAVANMKDSKPDDWEIHIVGHSAGSIFAGYALKILTEVGLPIASIQLMAPAIRCDLFCELYLDLLKKEKIPVPTQYILPDSRERGDSVGPYGKSLLYLVSNAFEDGRETPLLGMERFVRSDANDEPRWSDSDIDPDIESTFRRRIDHQPALVISDGEGKVPNKSSSRTHGGFDNDADTMNSVLHRILGEPPKRTFTQRELG